MATIYLSSNYEHLKNYRRVLFEPLRESCRCLLLIAARSMDHLSMSSIFLSYAGGDREVATQVALGLKGAGVEVWWDREGIKWGDNWIQKLEDALTQCGAANRTPPVYQALVPASCHAGLP